MFVFISINAGCTCYCNYIIEKLCKLIKQTNNFYENFMKCFSKTERQLVKNIQVKEVWMKQLLKKRKNSINI